MLNKEYTLIAYSGHAYVVAEAARLSGLPLISYANLQPVDYNPFGLVYAGNEENIAFDWQRYKYFILGIGDNRIRAKVYNRIRIKHGELITVIHPQAIVAPSANLGMGNFLAAGSCISTLAEIGNGCIVNTSAVVDHECKLEDFVHIGPGAVLAGNTHIGEGSFIGANAVIKQGIKIGKAVTVGAGSVIIKDIPDYTTVVGNPGRAI